MSVVDGADAGVSSPRPPNVILAAGSVPRTLPGFEIDGKIVVTSDEFLDLSALPERRGRHRRRSDRLRVRLAARPTWARKVTILEALPAILTGCDIEVANVVQTFVQEARHRDPNRCQDHRPQPREELDDD